MISVDPDILVGSPIVPKIVLPFHVAAGLVDKTPITFINVLLFMRVWKLGVSPNADNLPNISAPAPDPLLLTPTDVFNKLVGMSINVNVFEEGGGALLVKAISRGDMDIVDLLLEHGADTNTKNVDGDPVIFIPCGKGDDILTRNLR